MEKHRIVYVNLKKGKLFDINCIDKVYSTIRKMERAGTVHILQDERAALPIEESSIRNRLNDLLYEKKQHLKDGEILLLVKGGNVQAQFHNGEELCHVNGILNESLAAGIEELKGHWD